VAVRVTDLVAGYGDMMILNGVNLEADRTAITGIIGPNGAGKSTLLKAIFGYLKPRQGQVCYEGEDITGAAPRSILGRGLAYVPQARALFPSMTVYENLLLAGYTIRDRSVLKERIEEIFESYPLLRERRNQAAGTLSGGEQRILEIARALVLKPRMIMLDEPSAALSPKFAYEIYEHIIEVHKRGAGLIIVEQNVQMMLDVADRIYALELGRNAYTGPPDELRQSDRLRKLYLGRSAGEEGTP